MSDLAGERFGWIAAPAGDFDGDGYRDVLVGAPDRLGIPLDRPSTAYLVRGGPLDSFRPTLHLSEAGDRVIRLRTDLERVQFGKFLAGDLDWDRDGFSDVLVGTGSGITYLFYGAGREEEFLRGEVNGDGAIDLADPIAILERLFLGGAPLPCKDAADATDDGALDLSDPIAILRSLFLGAGPLPSPGPEECGADPTADGLGCEMGC